MTSGVSLAIGRRERAVTTTVRSTIREHRISVLVPDERLRVIHCDGSRAERRDGAHTQSCLPQRIRLTPGT
jgi:hypothetical protein